MKKIAERKAAMEARLKVLEGRMDEISEELDSHQSQDWEELATEREGDEVLEGMGLSAQAEIRAIRAALERIDTGEYGYCAKCGEEIAEERLDLLPYTPFCREHAS